ncbi:class I SAM-dependent methyltransferase [Cupriavidus necator]|uniref:class I SAM-dependent methyltransferase n=1 Tax=Cupriavidus necator TaxID=106590 RepID=UPI003F734A10
MAGYNSDSAEYYQQLHDSNAAFQRNNWLLEEISSLRRIGGSSILELGCGNGLFLDVAANYWDTVVGLDWAVSPLIQNVLARHQNVSFVQRDAREYRPAEKFDIVTSADFLEHLPPEHLSALLINLDQLGENNYHKIACYDDGHSHLSILDAETWLGLFNRSSLRNDYRIVSKSYRKGNPNSEIIIISNYEGHAKA